MKLTYPVCCGVDVHKTFLVATIIKNGRACSEVLQEAFLYFQS